MKMLIKYLLLIILISIAESRSEPDICDNKLLPLLLPGGTIPQVINMVTTGGVRNKFKCHNYKNLPFTQQDLKFRLYTRKHQSSDWLTLTHDNLINLDRSKPTKIIVVGWLCGGDAQKPIQNLIQNFLHRYDCNVITINHKKFSFGYYETAFCNLKKAADLFGDFLCELRLDFNRVHILGHSLGAHLAGLTGRRMKAKCNVMIDRITGLDPSGPIYQQLDRTQRLDKENARFVDIIHSNMGILGYYGPLGHIDFYADGGMFQSNCIKSNQASVILDIFLLPISLHICSHTRAIEYYSDSILGPKSTFQAKSCTLKPKAMPIGNCLSDRKAKYITMGEDIERTIFSATEFVWRSNKQYGYYYE